MSESEPAGTPSAAQQPTSTPSRPASLGPSLPSPSVQLPPGYGIGRRTHKKSRTGCATCKARKIKCDERHPACLNCISHGVECPFLKPGTAAPAPAPAHRRPPSRPKSRSPVSPSNAPTSYANPALEMEGLPVLELELLHNFTTNTYSTLTADGSLWTFWRDDVVQLGVRSDHDYIMRAVLAISALHLAYHRPDRRDFYTAQGILLHQRASRSAMRFMVADKEMDKDQAASLFLFSMLTMFFALASPRRSQPDGSFFIGEAGFPDWAFLVGGSKSLLNDVLGERGLETVVAPFLTYGRRRWEAQRATLKKLLSESESESESESSMLLLLAPLRARIYAAVSDPALLRTYAHALDELEVALVVRQDPGAPRDVLDAMVWLWEVSDSLVPLLKVPTQEAVAIFAHFCVLLKHHESHWWLQGWGDHLMLRAHEILDEAHREWIAWPIREMGWIGHVVP
ncbi:hypothetical protein VTK56DRAFT_3037 [Thermocarpiscus australiensis]